MKEENMIYCSHCGERIVDGEERFEVNEEIICMHCAENTIVCDCCGGRFWLSDSYSDDYISVCSDCYANYYSRCNSCNNLVHEDNAYFSGGRAYCESCYNDLDSSSIYEYSYKPVNPIFYGDASDENTDTKSRFFGVELEIDNGDDREDAAEDILEIANENEEHIYIKNDGSLSNGMEIVTHPFTLAYHKSFNWKEIISMARKYNFRSHQTDTCGLHIHVNRDSFGEFRVEQEIVISRILYFVERHWYEIVRFSRRTEESINHWASRYEYEPTPCALMEKAKAKSKRYHCVNLCNYHTIEFRMFKGTLKYNTFIATIEFVNAICDVAMKMDDEEIKKLSWSAFVEGIKEPELIQYLKERDLYVNEKVFAEEEV